MVKKAAVLYQDIFKTSSFFFFFDVIVIAEVGNAVQQAFGIMAMRMHTLKFRLDLKMSCSSPHVRTSVRQLHVRS